MKATLFVLSMLIILFSSCQKRKCKEQQIKDMARIEAELQQKLSNPNLTVQQIEAIKAQYDKQQKEILAECN